MFLISHTLLSSVLHVTPALNVAAGPLVRDAVVVIVTIFVFGGFAVVVQSR